jgi:hypothetical protein
VSNVEDCPTIWHALQLHRQFGSMISGRQQVASWIVAQPVNKFPVYSGSHCELQRSLQPANDRCPQPAQSILLTKTRLNAVLPHTLPCPRWRLTFTTPAKLRANLPSLNRSTCSAHLVFITQLYQSPASSCS